MQAEQRPAPVVSTAPMTCASLLSYDAVFSVMRDHSYGAERDPSTVGTDITFVRQMRQGMFDNSSSFVGSDDGSVKEQGVKIESEHDPRQASSSTGEDVPVFPNRLLPKPARKAPPTERPP